MVTLIDLLNDTRRGILSVPAVPAVRRRGMSDDIGAPTAGTEGIEGIEGKTSPLKWGVLRGYDSGHGWRAGDTILTVRKHMEGWVRFRHAPAIKWRI